MQAPCRRPNSAFAVTTPHSAEVQPARSVLYRRCRIRGMPSHVGHSFDCFQMQTGGKSCKVLSRKIVVARKDRPSLCGDSIPSVSGVLWRENSAILSTVLGAGGSDCGICQMSLLLFERMLTAVSFDVQGFAERKVLLLCDVIQWCKKTHNDEVRKERLAALKNRPVRSRHCKHCH